MHRHTICYLFCEVINGCRTKRFDQGKLLVATNRRKYISPHILCQLHAIMEEGESFLPHAIELLEHFETARASVGFGTVNPRGTLRVVAPASFGRMHLIPSIKQFLHEYSQLQVDLLLSDTVVDMVEGGFDIAIRDAALHDSNPVARKLAPVKRILIASAEYLAEHGEPQTPEDLANHQCINLIGLETWEFDSCRCFRGARTQLSTSSEILSSLGDIADQGRGRGI